MKKIIAVFLAIIMVCVPLTATASAAGFGIKDSAVGTESAADAEKEGGLFAPLTEMFNEIFNTIKELVIKILDLLGLSNTKEREFTPRSWEGEEGSVYQPLINEYNALLAASRSSADDCVIREYVHNSYMLMDNDGKNSVNAAIARRISAITPDYAEYTFSTADKASVADHIAPFTGVLNASSVKSGNRVLNSDGTSTITFTFYSESYTSDSTATSLLSNYGVLSKDDFNSATFEVKGFAAHIDNITLTATFDNATDLIVEQHLYLDGHYDVYGTNTISEDQSSTGWAYYDTHTSVQTSFVRK